MRRLFILLLVALLAGVGVVAMIETEPGYVLVSYGNYTLETSVWVGAVLLLLVVLVIYFGLALLSRLVHSPKSMSGWLDSRRTHRDAKLTNRGLINFFLDKARKGHHVSPVNSGFFKYDGLGWTSDGPLHFHSNFVRAIVTIADKQIINRILVDPDQLQTLLTNSIDKGLEVFNTGRP